MISYIAFRLLELAGQTSPVVKRLPLLMTTIQPAQSILRIVRSAVVGFTENFAKNFTFKMPIHAGQLQLLVSALSVLLPYQNSISVAWFSQSLINESAFFPILNSTCLNCFGHYPIPAPLHPTPIKKRRKEKKTEVKFQLNIRGYVA